MNLLRSICFFFGDCRREDKATYEGSGKADLGQKEAELEKTGKEQMSHMEGSSRTKTSGKKPE